VAAATPAAVAAERVCELITPGEASAALGVSVPAGVASTGPTGGHLCQYIEPKTGMLAISHTEDHGRETFDKAKAAIESNPAWVHENISGLGDQAIFANRAARGSQLLVLKGDKSIAIALTGRTVDSSKEALKELARKALSRL
jgi:hypothetical protein